MNKFRESDLKYMKGLFKYRQKIESILEKKQGFGKLIMVFPGLNDVVDYLVILN